ncbi:hypothetical protein SKAU_G00033990 [Synaphobranchus kaupii]|uniref:Uncharacterized protein n=1 Tax=Synaphobranchus kaupii TaxID=118154 RepID=A0A9Q1GE70_SYNKA|nr:hypothetical protein SKAU_G00033990 [Synaphobranchus kaupii]
MTAICFSASGYHGARQGRARPWRFGERESADVTEGGRWQRRVPPSEASRSSEHHLPALCPEEPLLQHCHETKPQTSSRKHSSFSHSKIPSLPGDMPSPIHAHTHPAALCS